MTIYDTEEAYGNSWQKQLRFNKKKPPAEPDWVWATRMTSSVLECVLCFTKGKPGFKVPVIHQVLILSRFL